MSKPLKMYRLHEYTCGAFKQIIGTPAPYPVHASMKKQLELKNKNCSYFIVLCA